MDTTTLAERWNGRLEGENRTVLGIATASLAGPGDLVFAFDAPAAAHASSTPGAERWAAIVVPADVVTRSDAVDSSGVCRLHVADPRLVFAWTTASFTREGTPNPGVDSTAVVDPSAVVDVTASIGAGAVIGPEARVEAGAIVDGGAIVGARSVVGTGARLFPRVVLYPGVRIGSRARIHAGAVLGGDGFGYASGPAGAVKIHHLGTLEVGDDVEIGANTTIDRGTLAATVIGCGTKIDNLVQIGHNVRIGRHCLIAGAVAIGGSSVLEDGVIVGGGAAITDHVTIHTGARIAGRSAVGRSVPAGEAWGGMPAQPLKAFLRERYLVGRLEKVWAFVRAGRRSDPPAQDDGGREQHG